MAQQAEREAALEVERNRQLMAFEVPSTCPSID
jgi:hypothetical protein